uniref:Uncharacterized protein LOC111115086 n=1 Tax=Crassostrea virginica TaxID=6565 RepID=A0A8B8C1C4_CRAVI|nr:uncharacterized protein LOC111115086 [Crassostrea virginica]
MIHAMQIFAGIVLFCLVEVYMQETPVQETEQHNELMRPEINPQTEIQPYCRNGKCAGISYREILNLYGGLFFTKKELQRKLLRKRAYTRKVQQTQRSEWGTIRKPISRLRKSINYDGDRCCPTSTNFVCFPTMINTRGQRRIIVHFPDLQPDPMYQLIIKGQCEQGGQCSTCLQEFAIHYVLVVDETFTKNPPLEFDEFYITSYCSCKGFLKTNNST